MIDPRITKLAETLVGYSCAVGSGEKTEALLAPESPTRRDSFDESNTGYQDPATKDDADIRLYFHYQGFPDIPTEVADAMSVYEDLMESGDSGTSRVVIPRTRSGRSDAGAAKRERGLHRLALLGIVADKELMAPGARPIEIVDGGKVRNDLLA